MNYLKEADKRTKEILDSLVDQLNYYGVESFKRQLTDYGNGKRSSNIADGMCGPLGKIRSAVDEQMRQWYPSNK